MWFDIYSLIYCLDTENVRKTSLGCLKSQCEKGPSEGSDAWATCNGSGINFETLIFISQQTKLLLKSLSILAKFSMQGLCTFVHWTCQNSTLADLVPHLLQMCAQNMKLVGFRLHPYERKVTFEKN